VACGSEIVTVNSPSGSTLECDTWLWDDVIEFARWQHPAVWQVDMSFCTSLQNFIQIGPPLAEKNDVMSIFKMADLSHLGF